MKLIDDYVLLKSKWNSYSNFTPSFLQKIVHLVFPLYCVFQWRRYRGIRREDCLSMSKKRKIFILFICFVGGAVLFLNGCEKPKMIHKESLGMILNADIAPTSFNEFPKMIIKTEKAIVTISIVTYIPLGEEAWHLEFSNGINRITWDSSRYSYKIR